MDEFLTAMSDRPVRETMNRLESEAHARGLTIFARVDHGFGAATAGLRLSPMQVLIVGSPRAGTPLIQANPLIGLDLPLRILVWENETNAVIISAINPEFIAERRGITDESARRAAHVMRITLVQLMQSAGPATSTPRHTLGT